MRFGAVYAAFFAAVCAFWAVPAAATTYLLSFDASGVAQDPGATPFSSLHVSVSVDSSGPATVISGLGTLVPFDAAFLGALGQTAPIDIPSNTDFAVGSGANAGKAAFGLYTGGTFTPEVLFSGAGLAGYNGVSALAPVSVTISQFAPFQIDYDGSTISVQFTSFANASFTALVPEPATWAMFLMGFGAIGWSLRSRNRAVAAA